MSPATGFWWPRLLLAGVLGGLLALSVHPGSRPYLLAGLGEGRAPLRRPGALPDPTDPVTSTLWFERALASDRQPSMDEALLLFEIAEAAARHEPDNGAWDERQSWCHRRLGNSQLAEAADQRSVAKPRFDDHFSGALAWHRQGLLGPLAWRRVGLTLCWPWPTTRPAGWGVQSVFAASLPGALLCASGAAALVALVGWALQRWGRAPAFVQGPAWLPAVGVLSLGLYASTRLVATSLWAALVLAVFGVLRERVHFHRAFSDRDAWLHTSLFLVAACLGSVGVVACSHPAVTLAQLDPRVAGLAGSGPGLLQATGLVASLSLGVSLIRAYAARSEPVVEALHHLTVAGTRTAVVIAVLSLAATPACIAWDGDLESRMAQSRSVGL